MPDVLTFVRRLRGSLRSSASFVVNQRTAEIGVRMALGAPRATVVGMIVGHGLTPVVLGLGVGLVGALSMTRVGAALLFAVEPTDPLTYAAVMATLACLGPASIDPMLALRTD
jgi:ABC-type antimicrobial peptide transport system permease subunit